MYLILSNENKIAFCFKKGCFIVLLDLKISDLGWKRGIVFRPESAKRGCFPGLGTSVVYAGVAGWWGGVYTLKLCPGPRYRYGRMADLDVNRDDLRCLMTASSCTVTTYWRLGWQNHQWHSASLQWRHNGRTGVSNHQPRDCLLNRLFGRRFKKTSKLRVTGLCAGNSPMTDEFPAQMASTADNVSIWWRHHVNGCP